MDWLYLFVKSIASASCDTNSAFFLLRTNLGFKQEGLKFHGWQFYKGIGTDKQWMNDYIILFNLHVLDVAIWHTVYKNIENAVINIDLFFC